MISMWKYLATITTFSIVVMHTHIPTESAPPGHFWMTESPLLVSGHEIFHSTSFSGKHIAGSVEYYNYFIYILHTVHILLGF